MFYELWTERSLKTQILSILGKLAEIHGIIKPSS